MFWHRFLVYGTSALLALAATTGCLKRKEKIKVQSDGDVTIRLKYKGTASELDSADAMPSAAAGWDLTRTVEENQDDKKPNEVKYVVRSKRKFAEGAELPSSYAKPGDPDADLFLSFRTTVTLDKRPDGTYYHFRRVYTPRKWAYVRYWEDHFFNEEIEKLTEKSTEELTREEQAKIVQAFMMLEAHSQVEFAKAALETCDPNLPSECWLMTRAAAMWPFNEIDYHELVDRYAALPEDERSSVFEAEYEEMVATAREMMIRELQDVGRYDAAKTAAFERAFDREKRYHEITDEQGSHQFKIMVEMPGELISHNGDRFDPEEPTYLVWEFKGDAFRDRPYELLAVSFLPAGSESK